VDHRLRRVATVDMVKHPLPKAHLEDITLLRRDTTRSPATRPLLSSHRMDTVRPRRTHPLVDQATRLTEVMVRRHHVVTDGYDVTGPLSLILGARL
jgi:hypothetical protein